jgi:hypothetical protein
MARALGIMLSFHRQRSPTFFRRSMAESPSEESELSGSETGEEEEEEDGSEESEESEEGESEDEEEGQHQVNYFFSF